MRDNFTPDRDDEEKDAILPVEEEGEEAEPIVLTDEEGNEYDLDLLDVIEYEGDNYAVLYPSDDAEVDSDQEEGVVILKVTPYEDGSAEFDGVEDTQILDAVFEIFMENLRQAFDEEE